MSPASDVQSVLIVAPNWLGDAVMALPALGDIQRKHEPAQLIVAARRGVSDLFRLVPFVTSVLTLEWEGAWWRRHRLRDDAQRLREANPDVAILFPNSFASAWLVRHAAVRERWGYASDWRKHLLTRAIVRPKGRRHQAEYYQHLARELGCENGPLEPVIAIPAGALEAARRRLGERGWDGIGPFIVLAPGAAYGKAKQWIPAYVAQLATRLVRDRGATCVFVGSRRDIPAIKDLRRAIPRDCEGRIIDLTGETTLEMLAALCRVSSACVSNDSGAMHLAAAAGAPVVAPFGPTEEWATAPLAAGHARIEVLTHPVWCRPCMLRECPIDHRCMTGIQPERVLAALDDVAFNREGHAQILERSH